MVVVIIHPNDNLWFTQQFQNATNAGLVVEAYVYLYFDEYYYDPTASAGQQCTYKGTVPDQVQRAINALLSSPLGAYYTRIWLDCEEEPSVCASFPSASQIVQLLQSAVTQIQNAQFTAGVYTRGSWWQTCTGDSNAFTSLPLWYANPDGNPDLLTDWSGFGGWYCPSAKQWGQTLIDGVWFDRDTILEGV